MDVSQLKKIMAERREAELRAFEEAPLQDFGQIATASEFKKTLEEGFFTQRWGKPAFIWVAVEEGIGTVKNGALACPVRDAKAALLHAIADARGISIQTVQACLGMDEEVPWWM